MPFPRDNNLDWLRLIFALQVMFVHLHLHIGLALPNWVLHFPGVPAFFFVSGFLVYASYLNGSGRRYVENRFLRVFPGLLVVTLGGLAITTFALGGRFLTGHFPDWLVWALAQLTIGQAYNPDYFREHGVGVINGSLRTITKEILFYLSVPAIAWMDRRCSYAIPALFVASYLIYSFAAPFFPTPVYRDKTIFDILELTPLVWGWMFFCGMLAFKHFHKVRPFLKWMPLAALPMAAMVAIGDFGAVTGSSGTRLGLLYFICYAGLMLYVAFYLPFRRLSSDISYGIYIWHMPIVNLLLILQYPSVWTAVFSTIAMGLLSWYLVEKPALKMKTDSLRAASSSGPR